jgi:hypothetical protein
MKKSLLPLIIIYLLFITSINLLSQTATPPAAGNGTPGNPYQIQTLDNLYWLSQNSSEWGKNYIQTANINASATSGWDGGAGFSPIGNYSVAFYGTYKGYVYTISNLFINRPGSEYVGLFGYTSSACIENVALVDVNITGNDYVGALTGANASTTLANCYSSGSVTGNDRIGSIAGSTSTLSSIINCYSVVGVTGNNTIGGLTGENIGSDIYHSYSCGSVSGTGTDVGGLIGRDQVGIVTN